MSPRLPVPKFTFELGEQTLLRAGTSARLADGDLLVTMKRCRKTWVQNEEMGYSYQAWIIFRCGSTETVFDFDWCDRTEGDDDPGGLDVSGYRIRFRVIREDACSFRVTRMDTGTTLEAEMPVS